MLIENPTSVLSCHLPVVVGVGRKEKKEEGEERGWMACEIVLVMVAVGWTSGTMVVMVVKEEEVDDDMTLDSVLVAIGVVTDVVMLAIIMWKGT